MDEQRALNAIRSLASSTSVRFTELVGTAGLDPTIDFLNADLSFTDLRGEDLRKFNFTHASFRGAQVQGALFNRTVKDRQLELAVKGVRGAVALIGRQIAANRVELAAGLGRNLIILDSIAKASQTVPYDRDRRVTEKRAFLHDSTDLARRRLSGPFKDHTRTLMHSDSAIILFEPESIFDFDTLGVAVRYFSQRSIRPIIFVLDNFLKDDGASPSLVRSRLEELPSSSLASFANAEGDTRLSIAAAREQVIRLLRLASNSILLTTRVGAVADSDFFDEGPRVTITEGKLGGRRALISAIQADLPDFMDRDRRRSHVLLREELYDRNIAEQLLKEMQSLGGHASLATFKGNVKSLPDYYVATGPSSSPLWDFLER